MINLLETPDEKGDRISVVVQDKPPDLYGAWFHRRNRLSLWKSNRLFFGCLLALCILMTAAAFWPVVQDFFAAYKHLDCAAEFGVHPKKPLYRHSFFWIWLVGLALVTGYYVLCLGLRQARWLRTLTLIGGFLYGAILVQVNDGIRSGQRALGGLASGNVFELQWHNLERLKIIECAPAQLLMAQVRANLRLRPLRTFSEFHEAVMEQYARCQADLQLRWGNAGPMDEATRKTLFIMNLVSGLWSFGNQRQVDEPGCVFCNERNTGNPPPSSLHSYLAAKIGCCTDFAYLSKSLLDHEGIENRLTAIPGHVFNEVRLHGRWCIVDASINTFMETSWEDLYVLEPGRDSIRVLLFPHPNLREEMPSRYRSLPGKFRLLMLLRAANHPAQLAKTAHPALPSYFD